jgi:hypothetical protein
MKSNYFIGQRPRADGGNYIHREDCPLLPSPGERIYLGTFLSPEEALAEGIKYFSNPAFCRFCLKEHQKEIRSHLLSEPIEKWDLISSVAVIPDWESALLCGTN